KKISKQNLQHWVEHATWHMLSEYTVAWIAAESPYGWELGQEWIESDRESIAAAGWSTLSSWVTIRPDDQLDLQRLLALLDRVVATLPNAPNRVRYTMNGFVIACGISVAPLTEQAIDLARRLGKVQVNVGNTDCRVPDAAAYIQNAIDKGHHGKKKKMARC
ncbi:MAG: DNA alkylation repair protein, partial [Saprospiraceae bacterium]